MQKKCKFSHESLCVSSPKKQKNTCQSSSKAYLWPSKTVIIVMVFLGYFSLELEEDPSKPDAPIHKTRP